MTRRTVHRLLALFLVDCLRHSANSCAFAAKTSATASLNSRPCSTRGRICSTHSSGICSTRFLPSTMNVSDQLGCPSPWAHRQLGFPQRLCVRASEPGRASGRDLQTTKQSVLALTQARGRISFSTVPVHLAVVLHLV